MMKLRTLKYHIEEGIGGILKNRLMSIASVATVAACAFILIVSLCIVLNIDYILEQFENDVGISVFIGDDVNDLQLENISRQLKGIENVREVIYMSKEDAFADAQEIWPMKTGILSGLENDNPLPRWFKIYMKTPQAQAQVVKEIEKIQRNLEVDMIKEKNDIDKNLSEEMIEIREKDVNINSKAVENIKAAEEQISSMNNDDYSYMGIENIRHAQQETEILLMISKILRVSSIILILIMCMVSVAIIMNTIKLTVFIRKNEISIMKYVGATDWFIRWPFMIEGLIIGLMGALIPLIICVLGYSEIIEVIHTDFSLLSNIAEFKSTGELFKVIFPLTVTVGMMLGAVGSITSMKQYLDV